MKKTILILSFPLLFFLGGCSCEVKCSDANAAPGCSGSVCNDGTRSNSCGQGTCSHHDGVAYELCKCAG